MPIFCSGSVLLITSPLVLLAALLIWLEDRGPVFYAQQRSGWLGRPFTVYKFLTMTVQPADAPAQWTQPGDQRITVVGDWLRRFRLDELPQLLNVLNGEMSLIGPRPERPELEEELEKRIPHYRKMRLNSLQRRSTKLPRRKCRADLLSGKREYPKQ